MVRLEWEGDDMVRVGLGRGRHQDGGARRGWKLRGDAVHRDCAMVLTERTRRGHCSLEFSWTFTLDLPNSHLPSQPCYFVTPERLCLCACLIYCISPSALVRYSVFYANGYYMVLTMALLSLQKQ